MSARRTKASRRRAFRAWVAQLAPPRETRPVWVVKIDPRLLQESARRVARALRDLARQMRSALRSAARVLVLSFDCPGVFTPGGAP